MSYLARLATDAVTAQRIMDALAETLDTEQAAAALVAEKDGRWAVELTFAREPDAAAVRDLVAQAAGKRLADALTFSTVQPRDWVKASLAGLQPVSAGRFVVHGGHDRDTIAPNRIAIEVEAALAFGTGHHATTRGCLIALDALVKRRRKRTRLIPPLKGEGAERSEAGGVNGKAGLTLRPAPYARHPPPLGEGLAIVASPRQERILDIGTGSGVLAIAAAMALRSSVLASDIDSTAVKAARENVRRNRAGPLIEVVRASGLAAARIRTRAPYDLVLANILLAPLKQLAAPMARVLRPGARVILSGLLTSQANAALAAYGTHGLVLERRIELDGWATLVMVRPARRGLSAP
ncbi:MAG: 50S ribosomal protein L11 methyltransferase [Xanthobacteraceae bacterium]